MVDYRIVVPSGIVFDFNNMLGAGRLQPQEVEQALQQQGAVAEKAVCELRRSGFAKKHFSYLFYKIRSWVAQKAR